MPRIAVAQMPCTPSPEQNVRHATDLITQARLCGARLLCLPDSVDYNVADPGHALSLATPLAANAVLSRLSSLAAQSDLWLSVGGVHELSADGTRVHKTHVLLSPHSNQPVATYRRVHTNTNHLLNSSSNNSIFNNNGPQLQPHNGGGDNDAALDKTVAAGDRFTVVTGTPVGNVGLLSGHDARFAASADALAAAGADLLAVAAPAPSALAPVTAAAGYNNGSLREAMLRTRAADSQCFVAAPARVRPEAGKADGAALIIAPDGSVLADGGAYGAGVIWADVDADLLRQVREANPLRKQRRDDVVGQVRPATVCNASSGGGYM